MKALTKKELITHLQRLGACYEAILWTQQQDGSAAQIWAKCERADWLLWLVFNCGMTPAARGPAIRIICTQALRIAGVALRKAAAWTAAKKHIKQPTVALREALDQIRAIRRVNRRTAICASKVLWRAVDICLNAGVPGDISDYLLAAADTMDSFCADGFSEQISEAPRFTVMCGIIRRHVKWAQVAAAMESVGCE